MGKRCKFQQVDGWRLSPRVVLRPGDLFRASGGPVWVGSRGEAVAMGERGVFRLSVVVVQGVKAWLVGSPIGGGGLVWVYVGKRAASRVVEGLRLVSHRVRRVRESSRPASGVAKWR